MAVTFFPFNSIVIDGVPDRPANAESLAAYLAGFFSNGVVMQNDTALQVEASGGMNVQIHAGMGNINGKTILADAAEIITLDTASVSLDRIDRVVFRLNEAERLMEFDVLTGTPASDPVAPELTQGAAVYELCLAEIRVPAGATSISASHITDTRTSAKLPNHTHDITDVGAVAIEKLWQNASVSSAFPAQNIDLDLSEYNFLIINHKAGTDYYGILGTIAAKGVDVRLINLVAGGTAPRTRTALFDDSQVKFYVGYNGGTQSNDVCIPISIYGIKGVQ